MSDDGIDPSARPQRDPRGFSTRALAAARAAAALSVPALGAV